MSSQQESSQRNEAAAREVFRGPGGVILWWVWLAVAVASLADLAVQGRDHTSAVAAAAVVAVTGIMYGCALWPKIVADADGVTVANPLREHQVPWGAVERVDTVGAVRVHCVAVPGAARGKIVNSWAVQSSPRVAAKREMAGRAGGRARRRGAEPVGYGRAPARPPHVRDQTAAESVALHLHERAEQARQSGAAGGRPVSHWAWKPIIAMLAPLALLAAVVLL